MPIFLRRIEPANLGRKVLSSLENGSNMVHSKEECANRTLANLIRQLGNLGTHANEIFAGLEDFVNAVQARSASLGKRAGQISALIEDLNAGLENTILDDPKDLCNAPAWRSKYANEAGLFAPGSRPRPVQAMYDKCEPVPNFDLLQDLVGDLDVGPKNYSDPGMFFRIWKEAYLSQVEQELKAKSKKSKRVLTSMSKKVVKPPRIFTYNEKIKMKELMKGNINKQPVQVELRKKSIITVQDALDHNDDDDDIVEEDNNFDEEFISNLPPPSPELWPDDSGGSEDLPTPPPAPVDEQVQELAPPSIIPPPPPLPPMALPSGIPPPPPMPSTCLEQVEQELIPNDMAAQLEAAKSGLKRRQVEESKIEEDERSQLLKQIRDGKKLRKIERQQSKLPSKAVNSFEEVMKQALDMRKAWHADSDDEESLASNGEMFENNSFNDDD